MKRNMTEIKAEGNEMARILGNGVRYAGPQIDKDELVYHLFNDDAVTDASFTALSLKEAKKSLIRKRKEFGAPPPSPFNDG